MLDTAKYCPMNSRYLLLPTQILEIKILINVTFHISILTFSTEYARSPHSSPIKCLLMEQKNLLPISKLCICLSLASFLDACKDADAQTIKK